MSGVAAIFQSAPKTVGRYRLDRVLGEGGMGQVYRGRLLGDGGFSRPVAIKRLRPELASNAQCVSMLLDEARILSFVRSPFVVETFDLVHHEGEFFVAMEYVDGTPLDRLMRANQAIPVEVAATIAVQILGGLHAAHTAKDERGQPLGIVHRDVSPSNVIVGVEGTSKLLDFGVAKARERVERTRSGVVKGKPSYMAPEQLFACPVDHRADVFAFGVVLWELLTGQRLFVNEILFGGVSEGRALGCVADPPSQASGRSDVAILDDIVCRALAMEPEDRFPTALAMAEAIEAVQRPNVRAVADFRARHQRTTAPSEAATQTDLDVSLVVPIDTEALAVPPSIAPRARQKWTRGTVASTVVGMLAALALAASFALPNERPAAAATIGPAPPPPSSVAEAAPVVVAPPIPEPTADPIVEFADDARTAAAASPSRASAAKAAVKVPRTGTKPRVTATADCQSPFRVEPDGTKIPKRECFRER